MTESGLNTKNSEIITLLTEMNQKFDSLLTALGVPPPTPTATLDDLKELLEDIHADTQSIDQKLLVIRNAIGIAGGSEGDSELPLLAMVDLLLSRVGIPTGGDTIFARLGSIDGNTENTALALGVPIGDASTTALGFLGSMQYALSNLNNVLGLPNFDGFVIPQYLAAIKLNTSICQCDPKDPEETEQCLTLLTSSGMVFFPSVEFAGVSFSNINSAVWPGPLPYDLEYGTVFGVAADKSGIVPAEGYTWEGWRIFAKSTADNFALITTSNSRYPTNEWIELTGTDEIAVIVDGGATVTGFLCRRDTSGPWEGGPDACAETPARSTATYDYYNFTDGRIDILTIAVFPDTLPDGIHFTSLELEHSNVEISPDTDWDGWQVYVETDSYTYATDLDYSQVYTSNQWRSLSGSQALIFVVYPPNTLTVTLCPPESVTIECMTESSITVESSPDNGYRFRQMVSFSELNPISSAEILPGVIVTYDQPVIHTGDLAGYRVNYVAGRARIVFGVLGVSNNVNVVLAPGDSIELSPDTDYFLVDDWVDVNTPGSGAFTVEVCPPESP